MKFLAVVAALLALTTGSAVEAQQPKKCYAPLQWEGTEHAHNEELGFSLRRFFSYDGALQRTAAYDNVHMEHHDHVRFHVIRLHREKLEYRINLRDHTCEYSDLDRPWHWIEVPQNATFAGEAYIGSSLPGAGVGVTVWSERNEEKKFGWEGAFTTIGCLPVHETFYHDRPGKTPAFAITHSSFYDITIVIRTPDVYIPPSQCTKVPPHHQE